jgi:hypothetical protein
MAIDARKMRGLEIANTIGNRSTVSAFIAQMYADGLQNLPILFNHMLTV